MRLTSLRLEIKLSRKPSNGEVMALKGAEASKKEEEWGKKRFCFHPNSQLDQFRHTRERKASTVYITDNENEKMFKIISVGKLFQCCQTKLASNFLQISVSGTGAAPLATGNTASNPKGNSHSTTCTLVSRPQNKARRTISLRPTFQSPSAQCASSNR